MRKSRTVDEYLRGAETTRPMELVYGVVREPPAPRYGHQSIVTRMTALLERHVRSLELGVVCVSPIDVVLDRDKALVVQPDIIFVSTERLSIIRERVWGAPDLVVEVLSARTAQRDRTDKLGWYQQYGVRECWLVDPAGRQIEIVDYRSAAGDGCRIYRDREPVQSRVLPALEVGAHECFPSLSG